MKAKQQVIIVDDDADDREIIRDAFLVHYPEPAYQFVENGERLMHLLEASGPLGLPDLILIDLNMPGKDGREALGELKNSDRFRAIPTVVFTTSSLASDRQMAYNLGANCFVTKPDTFQRMTELAQCLGRLWLGE